MSISIRQIQHHNYIPYVTHNSFGHPLPSVNQAATREAS